MTTTETSRPDLAAVKQRQQQTWASGDYSAVAARIALIAERLPFPDASFDAVLSCLGVMFAPRPGAGRGRAGPVCRPGGTIALANWTPTSFVGEIFRTVGKHVPPPAGLRPPGLGGPRSASTSCWARPCRG
jgi:hypothetical protein